MSATGYTTSMKMTPDAISGLLKQHKAPVVAMMVGVPGSGKSYIAQKMSEQLQWPVLSSDATRSELTGDENDLSRDKEVWPLLYSRAGQLLQQSESLIIDATHNNQPQRVTDIARYRAMGARTVSGIHVDTALDLCLQRNASRDRVVPDFVIKKFWNNLYRNPASISDGFDAVYTITP